MTPSVQNELKSAPSGLHLWALVSSGSPSFDRQPPSSASEEQAPSDLRSALPTSGASAIRPSGATSPGLPAALSPFEAEIVAVFADLVVLLGLPKSMGEIYGLVFASAEPPTFADIEQKLGLSKGSVSQGLRALRELGAVREAGGEGRGKADADSSSAFPPSSDAPGLRSSGPPFSAGATRATHWVATTELRQLIGTLLRERLTPYLSRQDQRMAAAETALESEAGGLPAKDYKALKNRLDKLQTWQSRARTVLPVLGKML